mmetsp:Transcript_20163/g.46989  ORF Transcript_20163/g.46989 Transcript_20163/m.46989 type:complete len:230 (-) Transcript_20163:521-1210(-)
MVVIACLIKVDKYYRDATSNGFSRKLIGRCNYQGAADNYQQVSFLDSLSRTLHSPRWHCLLEHHSLCAKWSGAFGAQGYRISLAHITHVASKVTSAIAEWFGVESCPVGCTDHATMVTMKFMHLLLWNTSLLMQRVNVLRDHSAQFLLLLKPCKEDMCRIWRCKKQFRVELPCHAPGGFLHLLVTVEVSDCHAVRVKLSPNRVTPRGRSEWRHSRLNRDTCPCECDDAR